MTDATGVAAIGSEGPSVDSPDRVYRTLLEKTAGYPLGVGILNIAGNARRFTERGANPGGHLYLIAREADRLFTYSISARSIGYRIDLQDYLYAPTLPDDPGRFTFIEEVNDPRRRVLYRGSDYHTTSARGSALLLFRDRPLPGRQRRPLPGYQSGKVIDRMREIIADLNTGKRIYQGLSDNCSTGTAEALIAGGFSPRLHRFRRFFGLDLPARIFNEMLVLGVEAGLDPLPVIAHRTTNVPRPYNFTAPPGLTLFLESFLRSALDPGSCKNLAVRIPLRLFSDGAGLRLSDPGVAYHRTSNALNLLRRANQTVSGRESPSHRA